MPTASVWMSSLAGRGGGWSRATIFPHRHQQGHAFSAAHHGPAQRRAKAAREQQIMKFPASPRRAPTIRYRSPGWAKKLYDLFIIALADFGCRQNSTSLRS